MKLYNNLKLNTAALEYALRERCALLEAIIREAREELKYLPAGRLRIGLSKRKNYLSYYRRADEHDKNGIYIGKNDLATAEGISWHEYLSLLIPAAEHELMQLKRLTPGEAESVYETLRTAPRGFVRPLYLTDEEYAAAWLAEPYEPAPMSIGGDKSFITARGEFVRSKSEVIIADRLAMYGVPYKYECPLRLGNHTVYPDFTCLNLRRRHVVYHEHLGMMDSADYMRNALHKIKLYEMNGLKLGRDVIYTMEMSDMPLDIVQLETMIRTYLC